MSIQTIEPATGEVLETFEPYSAAQINEILDEARNAFTRWRTTTFAERGAILHKVAAHLRKHKEELAVTATEEMGKPIVEAEAEVEKCAGTAISTQRTPRSFSPMNTLQATQPKVMSRFNPSALF